MEEVSLSTHNPAVHLQLAASSRLFSQRPEASSQKRLFWLFANS
jgi:hypothetical protein